MASSHVTDAFVTTAWAVHTETGVAHVKIPVSCKRSWKKGGAAYLLRRGIGAGIHFSAESERELGARYYAKYLPFN